MAPRMLTNRSAFSFSKAVWSACIKTKENQEVCTVINKGRYAGTGTYLLCKFTPNLRVHLTLRPFTSRHRRYLCTLLIVFNVSDFINFRNKFEHLLEILNILMVV